MLHLPNRIEPGSSVIAALQREIEAATRAAFAEMIRLHEREGICAFALYSDSGAMTVCPSTNTREHLEQHDDGDAYYEFAPAEWRYEMKGADSAFDAISTAARNHVLALGDDHARLSFRAALFEACVAVLERLKHEGYFRQALGRDIFLTFEVSDYEIGAEQQRRIIGRLNDANHRDRFFAWLKSSAS